MTAVFVVLTLQALMGAFDNLWHHELSARLPQRVSARHELRLHAMREALYGFLFLTFAWVRWDGAWVALPSLLLMIEIGITAADFLEEDRSRRLPGFERVLHTLLAVSYGLLVGLLVPLFRDQALLPTGLTRVDHGAWSWFFTLAGAGVLAWSLRNALAVRHLRAVEQGNRSPIAMPTGPAVLVTGGTGFIGQALVRQLIRTGRRVIVLSRDAMQARATFGPNVWVVERLSDVPHETRVEAIVNLAGATVLGMPWTRRRRQQLVDSRVQTTRQVLNLIHRLGERPKVMVTASAVGFYGTPGFEQVLTEDSPARPGQFQSDLCGAIEAESGRARALGLRVVNLRLGIVLGHGGGAYPLQALAARWGLGAILGTGRQPAPWIHLDDALGLIRLALTHGPLSGPVNAVAPQALTQAEFAQALADSFGRRARLAMPAWPLRLLLGEMSELLLSGQRVEPTRALGHGYVFRHAGIRTALADLAQPPLPAAQHPRANKLA
ncbi:TIGR01777 family oxidoreductase [Ideonella sp.]|uniref:TIGR01777 family oxidoreductase n=1 Tax=Ideonella sp. TaxID=1929293 RepID=UPI003BB5458B